MPFKTNGATTLSDGDEVKFSRQLAPSRAGESSESALERTVTIVGPFVGVIVPVVGRAVKSH